MFIFSRTNFEITFIIFVIRKYLIHLDKSMSQLCPTCGKIKLNDSLFCDDCTKKIRTEYEVDVPVPVDEHSEKNIKQNDAELSKPESEQSNTNYNRDNEYQPVGKKRKPFKSLLWIGVVALILIASFIVYNKTVRQKNLERSAWETAVKENSVDGFLAYIVSHPTGEHLEEAQSGLMRLKELEASAWERMKETGSISELRGFLQQYSTSPYVPLVKNRLDSLSWMVALYTNTVESYSEYISLTSRGEVKGEYLTLAENGYKLLYQSTPIDSEVLSNLRTTVNGFYTSLTSLDHSGMFRYLAPHVHRFFDSGGSSREKITGELLVTAAQSGGSRINFSPSLEDLQYKNSDNGSYIINIPVTKSYTSNGEAIQVPGYIAHIEVNNECQITGIYESKPFYGAP